MSARGTIPQYTDFRRAARDSASYEGVLGLRELPRTGEAVVPGSSATVAVALEFAEREQRRVTVTGQARTTLVLACQRCLEPADVALDVAVAAMVVVSDEAAANVPRQWEPVLAEADHLDLHALVDDELLLAIPITVHCNRPECRDTLAQYTTQDPELSEAEEDAPQKNNPFAALADFKPRGNDSN